MLPSAHGTRKLTDLRFRLMIGYINIFNGAMWTGFYAFLATFAILLVVNADMPMWTHFEFSQHLIRTSIQAFPTGVAITRSDLYKFCHSVTPKRTVEFHGLLLLLIA
jgi:hypothetical protein